jgi:hypothetical protein
MTLRYEANRLVETLWQIIAELENYDADDRRVYAKELAARLRPRVMVFDQAVSCDQSRSQANEVLSDVASIMEEVNGAATKGDMEIFHDNTLSRYWDLKTIFQESRYSGQEL